MRPPRNDLNAHVGFLTALLLLLAILLPAAASGVTGRGDDCERAPVELLGPLA